MNPKSFLAQSGGGRYIEKCRILEETFFGSGG